MAIEEIRARLERAFRPEAARGFDHVYQFRFGEQPTDAFHAIVVDGTLQVMRGDHPQPSVIFMFDAPGTALEVIEGRLDGMQAFMQGRIRTDGNLPLALQLGQLFGP